MEEDVDGVDTAYRVVADHARTVCIAIADGAVSFLPTSTGVMWSVVLLDVLPGSLTINCLRTWVKMLLIMRMLQTCLLG